MGESIEKVSRLGGVDGTTCDWGVEISCAPIHMLDEKDLHQIGKHLVNSQVVVIRDQKKP